MGAPSGRVSDTELVARSVAALARSTRFPVAFGGLEHDGAVHVSAVVGARTRRLDALVVRTGRGLGGRAVIEHRPRLTLDYRTAKGITHDYDAAILGEGIATLFAVPVMVDATPRGVLYCGTWGQSPLAGRTAEPALRIAEELSVELRIRDEVGRRLADRPAGRPEPPLTPSAREELRESYVELRRIAADVQDAGVRERLAQLERRLAALSRDEPATGDVRLSPRQIDVLACVAIGATNAEIAVSLGLKEVTIKSYLASAMAKLEASTRHAAVAKARRAGVLP